MTPKTAESEGASVDQIWVTVALGLLWAAEETMIPRCAMTNLQPLPPPDELLLLTQVSDTQRDALAAVALAAADRSLGEESDPKPKSQPTMVKETDPVTGPFMTVSVEIKEGESTVKARESVERSLPAGNEESPAGEATVTNTLASVAETAEANTLRVTEESVSQLVDCDAERPTAEEREVTKSPDPETVTIAEPVVAKFGEPSTVARTAASPERN